MKMKKIVKKTTKTFDRSEIDKKFTTFNDAILKVSFQEALINNQRLILDVLLDVQDLLVKNKT